MRGRCPRKNRKESDAKFWKRFYHDQRGFDIRKFYDAYDMTEDEIRICDLLYDRTEIQCVEIRELRRVLQEKLKQVRS